MLKSSKKSFVSILTDQTRVSFRIFLKFDQEKEKKNTLYVYAHTFTVQKNLLVKERTENRTMKSHGNKKNVQIHSTWSQMYVEKKKES